MTSEYSTIAVEDELLNKLRAYINFTDNRERIEEKQTTFTGNGTKSIFELSKNTMSFVKNVFVNDVKLIYGKDWVNHFRDDLSDSDTKRIGSVEFFNAPADEAVIEITWGEQIGDGQFIYDKFSKLTLEESNYPRIGMEITVNSRPRGHGGGDDYAISHSHLIQIQVVDVSIMRTKYISNEIENFLKKNIRNFWHFKTIFPSNLQSIDNFQDDGSRSFYRIINYEIPDIREVIQFAEAL